MYFALSDNAPFGLNPAARFFAKQDALRKMNRKAPNQDWCRNGIRLNSTCSFARREPLNVGNKK